MRRETRGEERRREEIRTEKKSSEETRGRMNRLREKNETLNMEWSYERRTRSRGEGEEKGKRKNGLKRKTKMINRRGRAHRGE